MAINNYIRPMLEVFQQLDITLNLTGDRLAACIVGADYDLYRYGHEDLTPNTFDMAEGSQQIELRYEKNSAYEYDVDLSTMKIQAENLYAKVGYTDNAAGGDDAQLQVDPDDLFVLRSANGGLVHWAASVDPGENTKMCGLEQVGDEILLLSEPIAVVDYTSMTDVLESEKFVRKATIVDFVGKTIPAKVVSVVGQEETSLWVASINDTHGTGEGSAIIPLTELDLPKLKEDTIYTITCTNKTSDATPTATLLITDSSGVDAAKTAEVELDTPSDVPYCSVDVVMPNAGVTLNIHCFTSITVGTIASVEVSAQHVSTTEFDGIRLNTPPVKLSQLEQYKLGNAENKSLGGMTVRSYTGPVDDLNIEAGTEDSHGQLESVVLSGVVTMDIGGKAVPMENGVGSLFLDYRTQIVPSITEDVFIVTSNEDIQKYFGTIHPSNDLAYGCSMALEGAAGRHIYALRVRSNDAAGYTEALNKVETNSSTYAFCPLTDDITVIEAACEYATKRSEPDVKRWCRVIAGVDSPGEYRVASTGIDGRPLRADILPAEGGYLLELSEDSGEFDFLQVQINGATSTVNAGYSASMQAGDLIELASTGVKYQIARVESSKTLWLTNGPTGGVENVAISVWKGDSTENAGEYVAATASRLNMRRCSLVWCDRGTKSITDTETIVMPNKFNAAFIAGLSSSVVPQAPITHTEVTSIDAAVRMYTRYRQIDLDNIARHGVMIITQDAKNQPCYIRHQLTTETDKGSLYYEESCTRNLDNISYSIVDVLEQYIGRSNVTPSALRAITTSVVETLTGFTQDSPSDLIGPSLVNWTDLSVVQDPIYKDRVIVRVKLYLPLPLNNIKVYEMAYSATVTI